MMSDKTITSATELSFAMRELQERVIIIPSKQKYLHRQSRSVRGGTHTDTTSDFYYVELINDTLRQIRAGLTAFVFNARQIADVKCFEPSAQFKYVDGAVAVTL